MSLGPDVEDKVTFLIAVERLHQSLTGSFEERTIRLRRVSYLVLHIQY
jgi:hypothetical protein